MANAAIQTQNLTIGYGDKSILTNLSLSIPEGKISIFLGANGCGKSTLLKSLVELLPAMSGDILLCGKPLRTYSRRNLARRMAYLPQTQVMPDGLRVIDLVARGRFPYRKWMQSLSRKDYEAITAAMTSMNIMELADRPVESLSGGQRQRVWIALALAQEADILLLDEPTTFLDIAFQVEILSALRQLNRQKGTTIVMVLHDINLSALYADHLFAFGHRTLLCQGSAEEMITPENLLSIYGLRCRVSHDPVSGKPYLLPDTP